MNYGTLKKIFKKHNIPDDARLMSDSRWECDATDMNGVFYNETENIVVFTQQSKSWDCFYTTNEWKSLCESNLNEDDDISEERWIEIKKILEESYEKERNGENEGITFEEFKEKYLGIDERLVDYYEQGKKVTFLFDDGRNKVEVMGTIEMVDRYIQDGNVNITYDIFGENGVLYKHVPSEDVLGEIKGD